MNPDMNIISQILEADSGKLDSVEFANIMMEAPAQLKALLEENEKLKTHTCDATWEDMAMLEQSNRTLLADIAMLREALKHYTLLPYGGNAEAVIALTSTARYGEGK